MVEQVVEVKKLKPIVVAIEGLLNEQKMTIVTLIASIPNGIVHVINGS